MPSIDQSMPRMNCELEQDIRAIGELYNTIIYPELEAIKRHYFKLFDQLDRFIPRVKPLTISVAMEDKNKTLSLVGERVELLMHDCTGPFFKRPSKADVIKRLSYIVNDIARYKREASDCGNEALGKARAELAERNKLSGEISVSRLTAGSELTALGIGVIQDLAVRFEMVQGEPGYDPRGYFNTTAKDCAIINRWYTGVSREEYGQYIAKHKKLLDDYQKRVDALIPPKSHVISSTFDDPIKE